MSNRSKTLNDEAWEKIFVKYDILNCIDAKGQFIISAPQIKEYREPRLMAKFDHRINLPYVFADNNLSILPISRGEYVISHFDAYQPFESLDESIIKVEFPSYIQSIEPHNITSESISINCAFLSGMLQDFLDEESLYPTVNGRMGSGQFGFGIRNTKENVLSQIDVENSQIEIDAAYEGYEKLALLEAKRDLSADFLVRQLYYPYRVWQSRVTKKVVPVFLVYTNGIFRFYEYEFANPGVYNSLSLVKQKNYTIEDTGIEMSDLMEVAKQIRFVCEPQIPFPQADKFERVINICELLAERPLDRNEVTEEYAFDIRQTNYYTDAARYLGLVHRSYESGKPVYNLTSLGKSIMELNYRQRQLAFCKCVLEHKVFYDVFIYCQKGHLPDKATIVEFMKQSNLYEIRSESTFTRRASTVLGWITWILDLISE